MESVQAGLMASMIMLNDAGKASGRSISKSSMQEISEILIHPFFIVVAIINGHQVIFGGIIVNGE